MANTRYTEQVAKAEELGTDASFPRFVIVITQFEAKVNASKISNIMKDYQHANTKTDKKIGIRGFHHRLAEEGDALSLSGYKYNAITPFLMEGGGEKLPIILSEDIVNLQPAYFWHSGGRI